MIAPGKVEEIKRLLATGEMSQREVARQAHVARATVAGIADGSRPDYEARRIAREGDLLEKKIGPLVRCPTCGGRVYAPCRLCRVRKSTPREAAQQNAQPPAADAG